LNILNRWEIIFVDFGYTTALVSETNYFLILDIRKFNGGTETDTNIISVFLTTKKFMANNPNHFY